MGHDRLLTNERRSVWANSSPDCAHCVGISESTLHVFRDFPLAGQVWFPLISSDSLKEFYEADLDSWIHLNLNGRMKAKSDNQWSAIFLVACYMLWKWRNKDIFKENFHRPS